MKLFLFCIIFLGITIHSAYSQDTIIKKSGEIILCKIKSIDSTSINIILKYHGNEIKTFIDKVDIQSFKYAIIPSVLFDKASLGIGLGMDYGSIGANLIIYPRKYLGLFAGIGIITGLNPLFSNSTNYVVGPVFNVGTKFRLVFNDTPRKLTPFALVMYGYNASVYYTNIHLHLLSGAQTTEENYNRIFYGPTLGIGFDYRSNTTRRSYLTVAFLIPIRNNSEINIYINDLNSNHGADEKNNFLPVELSIGYKLILN
jgi:hypothetical protein